MNLLIFLTHPEPTRSGYEKYLAPRHPELAIRTCGTRDEALKHAAWADILMCFGPQAKADFFKDTPKLKWVHSLGTGTDGITDSPYLGKDVIVTATRGIHGVPMSEMAFLMMLAFNRDMRRIERQRNEKKWERYPGTSRGRSVTCRASTRSTAGPRWRRRCATWTISCCCFRSRRTAATS
jgi:phosphoglycerate dehydrogenase-like enzyme